MSDANDDVRRKKLATRIKWGLGFGLAVIISPIVFMAIKGMIGLALAGAIGFALIQLAPTFSFKVANWRMKLLVSEVEANPIETMQNLLIEKQSELERASQKIVDFDTEVRNFDDQITTFQSQYPAEAANYVQLSEKMHTALEDMVTERNVAEHQLKDFGQQIKKAQAIYSMSMAAQKVTQLSKTAEAQVYADIKQQVAFDTVRTQLNRSFASLSQAVERRKATRAELPFHESPAISQTSTV
ncbi:hypothetical protein A2524_04405 [Candidatus Wolfebacteria bacterium RIFOXYD12_FULL_48_21]|uniref:Uncharacterized protein n=1 Tax=Candidatus Wolfebacteria bacterium RIFOXYD1_FULL_48_65 TaxID=1802561 RepID=A0A1F8E356_9BACT|nr:MAG: hypothetical protein A2610_03485 [Candidatus Wolfebacteria bacterium RIFOXYD1_FULL_48_65]OGM95286.1 MAG: hypothetical protein A2524_04405 [Candidatus Wolfebacteria bacterium RIFOXYD12_FULL_48_21]OGM96855.1 MAG: hypothetical protein A2532_01765 [Candidatus Wolfebacteria bacterium RIFOXYD2_FULL_48_11]